MQKNEMRGMNVSPARGSLPGPAGFGAAAHVLRVFQNPSSGKPVPGEPISLLLSLQQTLDNWKISKKMSTPSSLPEKILQLKTSSVFRELKVLDSACSRRVKFGDREYINLSSNNYLGLATDPVVLESAEKALKNYGAGAGSARLICGNNRLYEMLEERLASFKRTEAALVFSTGYMANLGIISAMAELFDEKGVILMDRLCHASIIDGCRLSGARFARYRHNDIADLAAHIQRSSCRFIITEGVFSMDGDLGNLPGILKASEASATMLMVDDAHSTGVIGAGGRGAVEHFGLEGMVDIQMGTLGKAIGSFGAYVAGSKDIITYIINRARPFIFTTGLPPSALGASLAALDIIENEPHRRAILWENQAYFLRCLKELGFDTGNCQSQIIPVMIGDSGKCLEFSMMLLAAGIYAPAIRPPTVPDGMARIRMTLMATHTREDLDYSLEMIEQAGKKLGINPDYS